MTGFSSSNNPRTTPAQEETLITVILKNAISQIIGRKGNKINKIQPQNNVEITTSLTASDYPDVKIIVNAYNNQQCIDWKVRLCYAKNFHKTAIHMVQTASFNAEIQYWNKNQSTTQWKNIHFNIIHGTSNVEIQNQKKLATQPIGQQLNSAKVIKDQIIQTINQKALTEIIQVSILHLLQTITDILQTFTDYLHQLLVAVK